MPRRVLLNALNKNPTSQARRNYEQTILNPIMLGNFREVLDSEWKDLSEIYPTGLANLWGLTPTHKRKWEDIELGDLAMFAWDQRFHSRATVTYKTHNREFAQAVWGAREGTGDLWEFVFFLSQPEPIEVPLEIVNEAAGYSYKHLMGFNLVRDEERAASVIQAVDKYVRGGEVSEDGQYFILQASQEKPRHGETEGETYHFTPNASGAWKQLSVAKNARFVYYRPGRGDEGTTRSYFGHGRIETIEQQEQEDAPYFIAHLSDYQRFKRPVPYTEYDPRGNAQLSIVKITQSEYEELIRRGTSSGLSLDQEELQRLKVKFLERTPGFETFNPPSGTYALWERRYKDELREFYREMVVPLLDRGARDGEIEGIVDAVHSLLTKRLTASGASQNLLNWRTVAVLRKFDKEGSRRLALALLDLLRGKDSSADRVERFNRIFEDLLKQIRQWTPSKTRSFPTLLLMLNNPSTEIFIRTTLFSELSKRLIGRDLFPISRGLNREEYLQALEFARAVKAELEDWGWEPQDMIDVQSFLWVAGSKEAVPATSAWIFQANPQYYDALGAITRLSEQTWLVKQHAELIKPGDTVYIWESGNEPGIIGQTTVIEGPADMEQAENERRFIRSEAERFEGTQLRVRLRVERVLEKRILRSELIRHPVLSGLAVIRGPQGTNFVVTKEERTALEELLGVPDRTILKVAPGESGEYWEEYYRDEVIGVGWNELGDLRQYADLEEFRGAYRKHYESTKNPSTISRETKALWKFRNLKAGDIIVANKGKSQILGIGTVRRGYIWRPDREGYKNVVDVKWDTTHAGDIPTHDTWQWTIVELSEEQLEALTAEPLVASWADLELEDILESAETHGLVLSQDVVASALAALRSGKHVILTGPPGTGKTTLAQAICESAFGKSICRGFSLTTATADWTTYETIGGLKPTASGELQFSSGHFLEAIERQHLLIIDELNRSNFDRAFGQLFTVLSGQAVQLPYERDEGAGRVWLVPEGQDIPAGADSIRIPGQWRIIATINVFDKSLLFEMSYALMRRFAFIEVSSPDLAVFEDLIEQAADTDAEAAQLAKRFLGLRELKDLGPAVFMDLARYLAARRKMPQDTEAGLMLDAFYAYLLPQFEGVDTVAGEKLHKVTSEILGGKRDPLRSILNQVLGLEIPATGQLEEVTESLG